MLRSNDVLSFIVPAYNEEFEIARTLAAVTAAAERSARPFEIIVVDDGSTDRTAQIAKDAGVNLVQIQKRQIAAARNAGARTARGDILFFVDADTRISARHIADAIAAMENGFSGGSARVAVEGKIPKWAELFIRVFSAVYFANGLGAGAFLFTTRSNFDQVGGFDEQYFAGEEVYLSLALKKLGQFKILPEPVVTSGRKLRMYSAKHILSRSLWIMLRGPVAVRSRRRLELWYDGKRETEPGA